MLSSWQCLGNKVTQQIRGKSSLLMTLGHGFAALFQAVMMTRPASGSAHYPIAVGHREMQ